MNRKLIRTRLSEIKERESQQPKEQGATDSAAGGTRNAVGASAAGDGTATGRAQTSAAGNGSASAASTNRKRQPTAETNAEVFYYKKQIETHTPMVILLQDGEEIEGTIEWYDRSALKINRKSAPNVMLLKHNIKYMYKLEDRVDD